MPECPHCNGTGWRKVDFDTQLHRCIHRPTKTRHPCELDTMCGRPKFHEGECDPRDETGKWYPRALAAYERSIGE